MKRGAVTGEMLDAALSDAPPPPASRAERFVALAQRQGAAAAAGGTAQPAAGSSALDAQVQGEGDQAAITRLVALGVTRRAAVEAYLACDRDEAMAANLLFDS